MKKNRSQAAAKDARPISMKEIIREIKAYRREWRALKTEKPAHTVANKKRKA
jgi:hypothetical protein